MGKRSKEQQRATILHAIRSGPDWSGGCDAPQSEQEAEKWSRAWQDVANSLSGNWKKRNDKISELLAAYVDSRIDETTIKMRKRQKTALFWVLCGGAIAFIAGILLCSAVALIRAVTVELVVALVSVLATCFASLVTLLKMIVQYFFSAEEEKNTIHMVNNIITSDLEQQKIFKP